VAHTDGAVVLLSLGCLQASGGLGIEGNKVVGMLLLFSAQIHNHCAKIKTAPSGIGVPDATDLIDNWIVMHGWSSMSSSGVQITGQTQPASSTNAAILCRFPTNKFGDEEREL
jgi:hypothetical protein